MNAPTKKLQGSRAWFEMIGTLLCEAIARDGPDPDLDWTLVERYSDGATLEDGLVQGIRIDIRGGKAGYRVGVRPDERGDATIEVMSATARALNLLHTADPGFGRAREAALGAGSLRIEGDLTPLAAALVRTHDQIVDRTI
ncbi:hypothetical protein [Azospirillum endophyticum]